ncbi:MAG: nucleotide exchange factor GrpE [Candidatus Thorarchaeota archaeon]|jgi:molecular chaperone GrpE
MRENNEGHHEMEEVSVDSSDDEEEAPEITPENALEEALEKERLKYDDLFERLQRLQAEFENYKKRMNTRFSEAAIYASEGILLKVLEVYDNLERAMEADFKSNPESTKEGLEAILNQFLKLFAQENVRPMESIGTGFDPYYQNAVGTTNEEDKPDNIVVEEYLKGYMIRDKVLRPAQVCVNKHQPQSAESEKTDELDNNEESHGEQ